MYQHIGVPGVSAVLVEPYPRFGLEGPAESRAARQVRGRNRVSASGGPSSGSHQALADSLALRRFFHCLSPPAGAASPPRVKVRDRFASADDSQLTREGVRPLAHLPTLRAPGPGPAASSTAAGRCGRARTASGSARRSGRYSRSQGPRPPRPCRTSGTPAWAEPSGRPARR